MNTNIFFIRIYDNYSSRVLKEANLCNKGMSTPETRPMTDSNEIQAAAGGKWLPCNNVRHLSIILFRINYVARRRYGIAIREYFDGQIELSMIQNCSCSYTPLDRIAGKRGKTWKNTVVVVPYCGCGGQQQQYYMQYLFVNCNLELWNY